MKKMALLKKVLGSDEICEFCGEHSKNIDYVYDEYFDNGVWLCDNCRGEKK